MMQIENSSISSIKMSVKQPLSCSSVVLFTYVN